MSADHLQFNQFRSSLIRLIRVIRVLFYWRDELLLFTHPLALTESFVAYDG